MQEPPITDFTSSVRYGHIQQNGQITFTDDLFRQRIKISHTPAPCLLCVARSSRAQPQAETLHDDYSIVWDRGPAYRRRAGGGGSNLPRLCLKRLYRVTLPGSRDATPAATASPPSRSHNCFCSVPSARRTARPPRAGAMLSPRPAPSGNSGCSMFRQASRREAY